MVSYTVLSSEDERMKEIALFCIVYRLLSTDITKYLI